MASNQKFSNMEIIISFPPTITKDYKYIFHEKVNNILGKIKKEIADWNGFVDCVEENSGTFKLIAKCDNEPIRQQMQELIDVAF
jgi:hypothetical protein